MTHLWESDCPRMFQVPEISVRLYHEALLSHETSCEAVVRIYLNLPPLFGVPIILKDTFGTVDVPTTAGSKSLVGLETEDAFVVRKLREAGAIFLGKGNCSEFCLNGCTSSSLGGQTLNPYDLTRTPGGSSGGTAVAIAANLAMVGCGGDTMNSIRSPASACNIIGLRPSAGQISRTGVFPCAWSQDAIGPMGRSIADVRILFNVMRGEDPEDGSTIGREHERLPQRVLNGRKPRIGILEYYFPSPDDNEDASTVLGVMGEALHRLREVADFIPIPANKIGVDQLDITTLLAQADVQNFEFATAVDKFLNSKHVKKSPHRSLQSIADSGDYNKSSVGDVFFNTLVPGVDTTSPDYPRHLRRTEDLYDTLTACLEEYEIDAVTFPHQRRLVMKVEGQRQLDRNGLLASLTGCPSLCIPGIDRSLLSLSAVQADLSLSAGFGPSTEDALLGVPVGMELVGRRGDDDLLLDIGTIMMDVLNTRKAPMVRETI